VESGGVISTGVWPIAESSTNPVPPLDYRSKAAPVRAPASGIAAALVAIVTGFILVFMSCGLIVGMMVAMANRADMRELLLPGIVVLIFAAILLLVGLVYLILGLKWLSRAARGHG
jgi:thiol:disulfide interchange protein